LRALIGAAQALPEDRDAQLDLLEYGLAYAAPALWLTSAKAALMRLAEDDEMALEYLFFAGHVARLSGDIKQAIGYFEALYQALPREVAGGDNDFKAELRAIITNLKAQN